MSRWVGVHEYLPPAGELVPVSTSSGALKLARVECVQYRDDEGYCWVVDGEAVSHWFEMPKPPEKRGSER